jgi:hypothetical protein
MRAFVAPHPGVVDPRDVALAVLHHRASPYAIARRDSNLLRFDTGAAEPLQLISWDHALNHWDLGRVVVLRRRHRHCHSSPLFAREACRWIRVPDASSRCSARAALGFRPALNRLPSVGGEPRPVPGRSATLSAGASSRATRRVRSGRASDITPILNPDNSHRKCELSGLSGGRRIGTNRGLTERSAVETTSKSVWQPPTQSCRRLATVFRLSAAQDLPPLASPTSCRGSAR